MCGDDQLYELARSAQNRAIKKALRKAQARQRPCTVLPEPALSPTQRQGRRVEEQAARHLEDHGLVIVAHNLRCKTGEIDLVALDQQVLVFIEVRSRHSRQYGGAAGTDGVAIAESGQAVIRNEAHEWGLLFDERLHRVSTYPFDRDIYQERFGMGDLRHGL